MSCEARGAREGRSLTSRWSRREMRKPAGSCRRRAVLVRGRACAGSSRGTRRLSVEPAGDVDECRAGTKPGRDDDDRVSLAHTPARSSICSEPAQTRSVEPPGCTRHRPATTYPPHDTPLLDEHRHHPRLAARHGAVQPARAPRRRRRRAGLGQPARPCRKDPRSVRPHSPLLPLPHQRASGSPRSPVTATRASTPSSASSSRIRTTPAHPPSSSTSAPRPARPRPPTPSRTTQPMTCPTSPAPRSRPSWSATTASYSARRTGLASRRSRAATRTRPR